MDYLQRLLEYDFSFISSDNVRARFDGVHVVVRDREVVCGGGGFSLKVAMTHMIRMFIVSEVEIC